MRAAGIAALLILAAVAVPASALWFGPRFNSVWRDRPIVVDGDGKDDWPSDRRDDAGDMSFGFANDAKDLYVMFAAHTKASKAQLGGTYGQDLSFWVDPRGGMGHVLGVGLTAPQKAGDDMIRVFTAIGSDAARSRYIEVRAGSLDEHGIIEARVPLQLLGNPPPRVVTVGLEAAMPVKIPHGTSDPKARSPDERFGVVRIWVRVKLAPPPKQDPR
jgi:hypothetical protein